MRQVYSEDGTAIAFDRVGQGPALILVGGAFQYRALDPRTGQLAALLASHFSVFHYDRRGRGDSGDTLPYAVEREVEDLAALIAEAGGSAYVYGMSSGATLALYAAAHGLAITRLALYEPPFIVDRSRAPLPDDYPTRLSELVAAGRRGDAVELFLTQGVEVPAAFVAEMRGTPSWPALEAVAHTLVYDGMVMSDMMTGSRSSLARWSSVTVPTLVVDGGNSPAWARNAVRALAETLPNAEHRTLEGQTHDVAAEPLATALERFFAG